MKKLATVFIAGGFIIYAGMSICIPAYAQEKKVNPYTALVTADSVNVRSGPGKNFEILRKVNKGESVLVTASLLDWYKIKLPPQSKAYVHAGFVAAAQNAFCGHITANKVNVRAGKGTNFNILGQLNRRDKIEIIQREQDWCHIFPFQGCSAWIHKDYVQKHGPAKIYLKREKRHRESLELFTKAEYFKKTQLTKNASDNQLAAVIQKYQTITRDYPQTRAAHKSHEVIGILKNTRMKHEPLKKQTEKSSAAPEKGPHVAEGKLVDSGRVLSRKGTHKLLQRKKVAYFLKSSKINLNDYIYHRVRVWGTIIPGEKSKIPTIEVNRILKLN